jgi:hypothetical protein
MQRMIDRCDGCLTVKKSLLGKPHFVLVPPDDFTSDMQRDNLEMIHREGSVSDPEWWVMQMLRVIPLQHWLQQWSLPAFIEMTPPPLWNSWIWSAFVHGFDAFFLEAHPYISIEHITSNNYHVMLMQLPQQVCEQKALELLRKMKHLDAHTLFAILLNIEQRWSLELTDRFLQVLGSHLQQHHQVPPTGNIQHDLIQFARFMHPDGLRLFPLFKPLHDDWKATLESMQATLLYRQRMLRAIDA